ncbi:putative aminodeoxychorismate lyase [Actinomyces bovis]|uniref:Endolytic murein transglycosylase n=1 Tax=Actinomyces bovis TaxID=1658 RepID=A0ABY1VPK3_9ACTO|nr:endolytic transglycosylase MltG [Actinomyces bovis]SPT54060.1 putative aminodeoxychorismate lyase [Actinomyces bovis]VEG53758.1 putative aminodeoxychorismate lyase [Actinomyces israelii]
MTDHDQDLLDAVGLTDSSSSTAPDGSRRRRSERRAERALRKRRRRRRAIITALVLAVLGSGVFFIGREAITEIKAANSSSTAVTDYPGPGETQVIITIPEGSTGMQIGEILQKNDVVASVKGFVEAFDANAHSGSIQPGTYTLKTKMSAAQAVAGLLDPASKSDHTLTIPEGFTKAQVRERLKTVGHFSEADIDAAFADAQGIGLPAVANGDVEGWLAPKTYDLQENATAKDVIATMVSTTIKHLEEAGIAEADYESALIKASIIEREANSAQYYPKVARVIENRLADTSGETNGLLQMDSTVLYGLGRSGGIPSETETKDSNNAYNTYVHKGLPPTPIGSPSKEALAAAKSPAEGSWLYFVTVDLTTGETLFASKASEHEANVQKLKTYCDTHKDQCSGTSSSSSGS